MVGVTKTGVGDVSVWTDKNRDTYGEPFFFQPPSDVLGLLKFTTPEPVLTSALFLARYLTECVIFQATTLDRAITRLLLPAFSASYSSPSVRLGPIPELAS
jgi:hypothetical protein